MIGWSVPSSTKIHALAVFLHTPIRSAVPKSSDLGHTAIGKDFAAGHDAAVV